MSVGFNESEGSSYSRSQQNVWPGQAGYLTDLYRRSAQLARDSSGMAQQSAAGAQDLLSAATPTFNSLLAGGDPTQLNADIDAMAADVNRNLTEQFLPALSSSAVATGGVGNPRASIAAGQAAGEASRAVASTSANMRNAYAQRGLGAIQAFPAFAAAQTSPLQNLWTPEVMQRGILGAPVTLGNSYGSSSSNSKGMSAGIV